MTLAPFTISPFLDLLEFHPAPAPWSARQIQAWSPITSLLLMIMPATVLAAPAPPARQKISHRQVGLAAWLFALLGSPTWIR